ncbi:hypothetical protein C8R44DRAFT_890051 [Mycena epipterygia]|nr:hypothetical protein C8R44DRAFT_890051 [Mycena epipterygia]
MADDPFHPQKACPDLSPCAAGAFFPNAHNFTIAGGQFTSIINASPTILSGFRPIPLGDLDLHNEIHLNEGGIINRHRVLCPAKRIYSVRIGGRKSVMTVALYQGQNAEKTWKRELATYSGLRHPNIVQLYGVVNSGGVYGTIFHDELVPVKQFLDQYQHSVMSTVYLYSYLTKELEDAEEYFQSLFRAPHWARLHFLPQRLRL